MTMISKKDLLAATGISYGQLYRWKRERLIPEEWFIKKSSYTGQETFFPREQILSRIASIMELKDNFSLEEMADIMSTKGKDSIGKAQLEDISEISPKLLGWLSELYDKSEYNDMEVAFFVAIGRMAEEQDLPEMFEVVRRAAGVAGQQEGASVVCTVFQSGDCFHATFSSQEPKFDSGIQVIGSQNISEIASALKLKYKRSQKSYGKF